MVFQSYSSTFLIMSLIVIGISFSLYYDKYCSRMLQMQFLQVILQCI